MIAGENGSEDSRPNWLREGNADNSAGENRGENGGDGAEPLSSSSSWSLPQGEEDAPGVASSYPSPPPFERARRISAILALLLSLASIAVVSAWVSNEAVGGGGVAWSTPGQASKVFNWHPVLMVCAFGFMTASTLSFRTAPWSGKLQRTTNKYIHASCWVLASICGGVGVLAVFKSHNDPESGYISNLYSLHSWIGVTVMSFYALQLLSATFCFGLKASSKSSSKATVLLFHRFAGKCIYYAAAATILMGIQEKEGFIGCSYKVEDGPDLYPAAHFFDIPAACRTSHGLGLMILATTICAGFAMNGV